MGRRKREPMSEGKKNIIGMLLEEYDIRYHRPPSSADRGLAETSSGRGLSHCIYGCCTFFCTRKRTDKKLAAYVILAVSLTGHKEVLSIHIGENESAKYWLGVLNELKNRGVKDVLVICADGLSGMKEAVNTAFPQTELQRCNVHQVRNTLKYVGAKKQERIFQRFENHLSRTV